MNNYSIGDRIRNLRLSKHLSQEKVALRACITTAYLGQIERGEKNPTVKLVGKIANVLEISLSELFSNQSVISEEDEFIDNIIFEIKQLSEKEKKEILMQNYFIGCYSIENLNLNNKKTPPIRLVQVVI